VQQLQLDPAAVLPLLKNAFVSGGLLLMAAGAAIAWFRNLPAAVWGWLLRRCTISVDVVTPDPAFRWLSVWLDAQPYAKRARALSATAKREGEATTGVLLTPAPGNHVFRYRWRPVWLSRHRDKESVGGGNQDVLAAFLGMPKETIELRVFGRSQAAVRAILEEARVAASKLDEEAPAVWSGDGGYWQSRGTIRRRPIESVVLPAGVAERLVDDLRTFRSRRKWYEDRAVPWHRGYLFHGLPGTGKTSLVAALAHEFRLSIYVLNVAACGSDAVLGELTARVGENAILLLEDVDAALQNRSAPTAKRGRRPAARPPGQPDDGGRRSGGVTLTGLLNAIDGLATADGQVTILTTNHLPHLDPALVRPGRADVWVEFGLADADQAARLFARFYGAAPGAEAFGAAMAALGVTGAEIQQHLLRHEGDPAGALAEAGQVGLERRSQGAA
jgi:chaperone BCS1